MNLGQVQIESRTNQTGHGTPIATLERPGKNPNNGQSTGNRPPIPIRKAPSTTNTAYDPTIAPGATPQRAPGQPPPLIRAKQTTSSDVLTSAPSASAILTPQPVQVQQPPPGRKNTVLGIAPPVSTNTGATALPQQPSDKGEHMEPRGRLPSDAIGLRLANQHQLQFPEPDLSPAPGPLLAPKAPREAVDPDNAKTTVYTGDNAETTHYEAPRQAAPTPLAQRVVPFIPMQARPPVIQGTQRGLSAPPPSQAVAQPRSVSPVPFQQPPSTVVPRSSNPPPRLNSGTTVPPQGIKSLTAMTHEYPNLRTLFDLLERTVTESEEQDTLLELQHGLDTATTPETKAHCYAAIGYLRGRIIGRKASGTTSAPAPVVVATPQPAKPTKPTDFGLIAAILLNLLLPFIIIAPLKGMMEMDWGGAIAIAVAVTVISFLPVLFKDRKKPYGSKSAINLAVVLATVITMVVATHLHKTDKESSRIPEKSVATKTVKAAAKPKPAPAATESAESDSSDSER